MERAQVNELLNNIELKVLGMCREMHTWGELIDGYSCNDQEDGLDTEKIIGITQTLGHLSDETEFLFKEFSQKTASSKPRKIEAMGVNNYREAYLRLSTFLHDFKDGLGVLDWALVGIIAGPHETGEEEFSQFAGVFSDYYDRVKEECDKVERQSEFLREKLRQGESEPQ